MIRSKQMINERNKMKQTFPATFRIKVSPHTAQHLLSYHLSYFIKVTHYLTYSYIVTDKADSKKKKNLHNSLYIKVAAKTTKY